MDDKKGIYDNWFDNECKNFKQNVNRAMRKYRASGSNADREDFCEMRRNYKRLINNKKWDFYNEKSRKIMEAARQKNKELFGHFSVVRNQSLMTSPH